MRERGTGMIVNMSSMDGMTSLAANGFYSSSKFALEGATEALWQEIEPLGLHAVLIEPGSFRTGIETRTHFSGDRIDAYVATSGAFRAAMETNSDAMFPGDPALAAAAIFTALKSESPPHRLILGSDAYQRIGAKLDSLRLEYDAGRELAYSTDIRR
jgi:short-subunit dehydrogenase